MKIAEAKISRQKQRDEIIKCGRDASYFINQYVKIQHPIRGLIPFGTFEFQDKCLDDFNKYRFNVVLKSRQLGISTVAAAYSLWMALFYRDKAILVIATKLSVAQNFIKKVKVALQNLPSWLVLPEIKTDTKQSVEFTNGSSVKAVPTSEDAGRSEALTLLIIDEAAFIGNFEELWMGLYPTLSTGGRAIVLSTPNGVGGQFHKLYVDAESGANEFNPIKLMWNVHPEHDQKWFDKESKNMSQKQIAQELLCDFASSGDTFLNSTDIDYIRKYVKPPLERWGPELNVWVWKYAIEDHEYLIAADVARGDASDFSTFHVIDTISSEQVCEFKGKIPPDQFAVLLAEAGNRYHKAMICPENNSYGYTVCLKLHEAKYPNLYYQNKKNILIGSEDVSNIGFTTGPANRTKILTKLEEMLRNKQIIINSQRLYEELKTFSWQGLTARAMKGYNDDLIMALAIGTWLYEMGGSCNVDKAAINDAMLGAFAINTNLEKVIGTVPHPTKNPYGPIYTDFLDMSPSANGIYDSRRIYSKFGWLIKG